MKIFKRLYHYISPYMKYMIFAFIFTLLLVFLPLVQPILIKLLTDYVLTNNQLIASVKIHYLKLIVVSFFLLVLLKGYFAFNQGYLMNYGGQSALRKMRDDYFSRLQQMQLGFFSRWRHGELYSRGTSDITLVISFYTNVIFMVQDILTILFCIGVMFYMDWFMTVINLMVSPLIVLAIAKFGRYVEKATHRLQGKVADLTSIIHESVSNVKIVKSFTREDYQINKFKDKNEENFLSQMKLIQFTVTQGPVVEFLAAIGFVVVVVMGTLRVVKGTMTLGDIMAYWGFLVLMSNPINRSSGLYTMFRIAKAAAERVFEIMDFPIEEEGEKGKTDIPEIKGHINYKDMVFSYDPSRIILDNICLDIKPGEVVALVGLNGAGKTTLVNLLSGFYKPVNGTLEIDGYDISRVTLKSLRRQIALVPQETLLFSGTIKENILYGKLDASDEEVIQASKIARAHDFIMKLPEGYDTAIIEQGMRLSGGQRQRIAVARALLKDPKILILDEYTSGMDTESEHLVAEAIEYLMKGRTCLVIAHRISTVCRADKIVVLHEGRILETGNHASLLEKGGLYSRLYKAQFKNLEMAGEKN